VEQRDHAEPIAVPRERVFEESFDRADEVGDAEFAADLEQA
jgi:hypothetical protein